MVDVKKTTYQVDGCEEPCFEVTDGFVMVRIAKMYHFIGKSTIAISEYHEGKWNGSDEWEGDFDSLTVTDALRLARKFSAYLEHWNVKSVRLA